MSTEMTPQEPEASRQFAADIAAHLKKSDWVRPAAPVAQEPPAPVLGSCTCGHDEAVHTLHDNTCWDEGPFDCDCRKFQLVRSPTPERVMMDWIDANDVTVRGATPAMLMSVARKALGIAVPVPDAGESFVRRTERAPGSAQEPADPPMTDYRLARIRERLHDDKESMITTADELGDWHMVLSEGGLTGVVIDSHDRPRLVCEGEDGVLYVTSVGGEDGDPPWDKAVMELWAYGPFRVIWPVQS